MNQISNILICQSFCRIVRLTMEVVCRRQWGSIVWLLVIFQIFFPLGHCSAEYSERFFLVFYQLVIPKRKIYKGIAGISEVLPVSDLFIFQKLQEYFEQDIRWSIELWSPAGYRTKTGKKKKSIVC